MTETVDITPNLVYTEAVQILRDFINNLSIAFASGDIEQFQNIYDALLGINGPAVSDAREAMREILTQDIELQIANKTFPLPKHARMIG